MGEIVIFRQYNRIWPFHRWSVYANGQRIGRIRNNRFGTFSLPSGKYDLQVKCTDNTHLQSLYSNILTLTVTGEDKIVLDVRIHPLFFLNHGPKWFRETESLLLLDMNDNFDARLAGIENGKQEITAYFQKLKLHTGTRALILLSATILIATNIAWPDAFIDRKAWGLFFGVLNLGGALVFGKWQKSALAGGYEYHQHIGMFLAMIFICHDCLRSGYRNLLVLYLLLGAIHLCMGTWLYINRRKAINFAQKLSGD